MGINSELMQVHFEYITMSPLVQQVDEEVQTRESEKSDASPASQQQSGVTTPLEEGLDSTDPQPAQPAGHGMEKKYTDTIESLLSELWKERLVWSCRLVLLCMFGHQQSTTQLGLLAMVSSTN